MRGEKDAEYVWDTVNEGSTPRAWGKAFFVAVRAKCNGINPTCVGKRLLFPRKDTKKIPFFIQLHTKLSRFSRLSAFIVYKKYLTSKPTFVFAAFLDSWFLDRPFLAFEWFSINSFPFLRTVHCTCSGNSGSSRSACKYDIPG